MNLQVVTAIPLDVHRGSGCYVGIRTLVEGLRRQGIGVSLVTPRTIAPVYTLNRVLFNEALRWRRFRADATIGVDADGYTVAGRRNAPPHVACIKGVLADAVPYETGRTRASLAFQARLEAIHARRADLVITPSHYCARRVAELYGVEQAVVVPELIDLEAWRHWFRVNAAAVDPRKFTVLSVCRFYPRKRLEILLRAAAILRQRIPQLEIRIVGNGPEYKRLRQIHGELHLDPIVRWLGDVPIAQLAEEYNRADIFCLPSVQEGFGIVFLEAMAAGKPIVAARAAAVPEVVRHGILTEPDNPEALAEAIAGLYRDPGLRKSLASESLRDVQCFGIDRVAARFLSEVLKIAPGIEIATAIQHAN